MSLSWEKIFNGERYLGYRKTAYWFITLLCLNWGAVRFNATFDNYSNSLLILAATVLGIHTLQQIKQPPERAAKAPKEE